MGQPAIISCGDPRVAEQASLLRELADRLEAGYPPLPEELAELLEDTLDSLDAHIARIEDQEATARGEKAIPYEEFRQELGLDRE